MHMTWPALNRRARARVQYQDIRTGDCHGQVSGGSKLSQQFGDRDVVIIGELPDNTSAAALALRVNAAGVTTCKTTVLLTAQEIDNAVTKSGTYRPPGQDTPYEVANWEGEGGHLAGGS